MLEVNEVSDDSADGGWASEHISEHIPCQYDRESEHKPVMRGTNPVFNCEAAIPATCAPRLNPTMCNPRRAAAWVSRIRLSRKLASLRPASIVFRAATS